MSVHVLIAIFQVWHLLCNPCLFHVTRCVDKVITLNVLSDEMSRQNKKNSFNTQRKESAYRTNVRPQVKWCSNIWHQWQKNHTLG